MTPYELELLKCRYPPAHFQEALTQLVGETRPDDVERQTAANDARYWRLAEEYERKHRKKSRSGLPTSNGRARSG